MTDDANTAHNDINVLQGTLVTGDFIIDQHIYEGGRKHFADRTPGVRVKPEVGGAGKLADIIAELFQKSQCNKLESARKVVAAKNPPEAALLGITEGAQSTSVEHHAYAFWRPLPEGKTRDKQRWKCTEAMGFGGIISEEKPRASTMPCVCWKDSSIPLDRPKFIVISEGGMGFRETSACWQNLVRDERTQVILKTARNPTQSGLWEKLQEHREQLTVIISASELRKIDARISSGLTWEETFQDFLREISDSPKGRLCELKNCRNLIVAFDSDAAIAVRMKKAGRLSDATVTFVYHASAIEEDLKNDTPGTAFGLLTCFTAAVTLAIAQEDADFGPALEAGLAAMQDLLKNGHGPASETPIGFPVDRIVNVILNPNVRFTRVSFPFATVNPYRDGGHQWSFLELAEPAAISRSAPAFEFAQLTAEYGQVALNDLPHFSIGHLFTVDCVEITALRNIRQLLRRYDKSKAEKKPLSIGVFGPPGAGKSFAVEEIAKNLFDDRSEFLVFNLSQFAGAEDLNGAFHQIRDSVLKGMLPIAFFDEFDSRDYHWLQYLLAPMQDGKFQEGESTHTIGKCIFVFAGGTSWTFDTFGPEKPSERTEIARTQHHVLQDQAAEVAYSHFRLAKGPDFQSRLDGYLNVVGPNPRTRELTESERDGREKINGPIKRLGTRLLVEDQNDIWWPIRRALMLRGRLKLKPDKKLDITPSLLSALLRVPFFRHGSRSMEKILAPMQTAGMFRPSFVPHRSQLELHTDADKFLELLENESTSVAGVHKLDEEAIKRIAPRIHEVWSEFSVRNGSLLQADVKSLSDEINSFEVQKEREQDTLSKSTDHAEREASEKKIGEFDSKLTSLNSNFDAARRMQRLLAIVGLAIAPIPSEEPDADYAEAIKRLLEFHLELLASEEHRAWMERYHELGWTYHPKAVRSQKQHACLIPYPDLEEVEKLKDRTQVLHFDVFLRKAGYRVEQITTTAVTGTP